MAPPPPHAHLFSCELQAQLAASVPSTVGRAIESELRKPLKQWQAAFDAAKVGWPPDRECPATPHTSASSAAMHPALPTICYGPLSPLSQERMPQLERKRIAYDAARRHLEHAGSGEGAHKAHEVAAKEAKYERKSCPPLPLPHPNPPRLIVT